MTDTHSSWCIGLLDSFRIEKDDQIMRRFDSRKQDLLLAYLALFPDKPHQRKTLAQLLWPDRSEKRQRSRLAEVLFHLRSDLEEAEAPGEVILPDRYRLRLNPAIHTDVQRFTALYQKALTADSPRAQRELLTQAVPLHGDGLLPHLTHLEWVATEHKRLQALYRQAQSILTQSLERAGKRTQLQLLVAQGHLPPPEVAVASSPGKTPAVETPPPLVEAPARDEAVEELERRHAQRIVELTDGVSDHLVSPDRTAWLERLDAQREGINLALQWALEAEEPDVALHIAGNLWRYFLLREEIDEGRRALAQALALASARTTPSYALAVHGAGTLALQAGDLATAERHLQTARKLWQELHNEQMVSRVLINLGIIAYQRTNYRTARRLYAHALTALRQAEETDLVIDLLKNAALVEMSDGHPEQALVLLTERLEHCRARGDELSQAWTLVDMASAMQYQEAWGDAADMLDEAQTVFEAQPDLAGIALCERSRGYVALQQGALHQARVHLNRSLRIDHARGAMRDVGEDLRYLAAVEEELGNFDEAVKLLEQAVALLAGAGDNAVADARRCLLELRDRMQ